MIFIVRHGERADNVADEKERKKITLDQDPPLTELGIKQAVSSAMVILSQIGNQGQTKQVIVSSPFQRCVMTSNNIAKQLPNIVNDKIYLQDSLGEWLLGAWFKKDVMTELWIKKATMEERKNVSEQEIEKEFVDSESIIIPKFPEDFEDGGQRFLFCFNAIKDQFLEKYNIQNTALIIITHGYGVQCVLETYNAFQFKADYCCVTQLDFLNSKNKDEPYVILAAFDEHIKRLKAQST